MVMKINSVPFAEAKTHLSKYGALAEQGQTTLVLKHRRSAFLIAPVPKRVTARPKFPGVARGRIRLEPDFDQTPVEVIEAFEGQT